MTLVKSSTFGHAFLFSVLLLPHFLFAQASSHSGSDGINYSICRGEKPYRELLAVVNRQLSWDAANGKLGNSLRSRLRFEKIDEKPAAQGSVGRYRVFVEGAPENKIYALSFWSIGKEVSFEPRFIYVNEQGLLMLHKPRPEQETSLGLGEEEELEVMPLTASAEPVRYMLSSQDQELSILGTLVPHPVFAVDNGCKVEVRMAGPGEAAMLIMIEGFPVKSRVPIVSVSDGETLNELVITDGSGKAAIVDYPHLKGKSSGIVKVFAEGPGCIPLVQLPWGASDPAKPENKP